jgi:hypothetical protein
MSDYLYDKQGHDPEVERLEAVLADFRAPAPLRPLPRRLGWWRVAAGVSGVALAAAAALAAWWRPAPPAPVCAPGTAGLSFSVAGGMARCGAADSAGGVVPVGGWLETPSGVLATVKVADIGEVTLHGDSRLRVVGTADAGHRLELARGRMSAIVSAPPRLFVVDTPVAAAVDLGCAYELAVAGDGTTHLRVETGAVSLEGRGLASWAPAGTEVRARPGHGPGTPVALHAPSSLRDALERFDAGDASTLAAAVAASGPADAPTLWNLLSRTRGPDRDAVIARLEAVAGRPEDVPVAAVQAGQAQALERWREAIESRI